ncbi:MAG: hypothetical protein K8963_08895, partial [Proteobacteria bacterium]|nr:hypothetical protein [Pseudomonadota bacterium]
DASQPASAGNPEADARQPANASKPEADASQPASASKLKADASQSASSSNPEADARQPANASKLKADASQSASKSNQETDAHQPNSKSNSEKAYQHFSQATDLADGAFMAGYLACLNNEHLKAIDHFKTAIEKSTTLGNHFNQYKISLQIKLSISDDIEAIIIPDHRGAILGLIEAYQASKNYTQAINHLQALRKTNPKDNLILLALVEMLYEHKPGNKANLKRIDTITNDCENTNFIECAILLYRAKALIALSQTLAARDTLTLALRKRKNCPTPLRHALLHKRAATFEALNQTARAQADLQSIHTENPNYEDVSKRLTT